MSWQEPLPRPRKPGTLSGVLRRAAAPLALSAVVALAAVHGCGPSVSSIYEGNIRFEHCYRLDLDPNIASTHRTACWREWTRGYTYGQTRDRLEYARRRIAALEAGDTSRPVLDLSADPDAGQAATSPAEAPAPTSLHKPPPPTLKTAAPPPPPPVTRSDAGPSAPEELCTRECRANWRGCATECGADAGPPSTACANCQKDYKSCMQRCFK